MTKTDFYQVEEKKEKLVLMFIESAALYMSAYWFYSLLFTRTKNSCGFSIQ